MKQMNITEKQIGDSTFYIKPFPAFTAANISGELAALITPILGGLAPLLGDGKEHGNIDVMDLEVEKVLPSLTEAFSGISGEKFEKLMRKLLIDSKNISVENEDTTGGAVKVLTYDLANEVFCEEVQDMYILCWYVIKVNFGSFFRKLGARFGNLQEVIQRMTPGSGNMEN